MDSARFDKFTRDLLAASSRRETVKTLVAGLGAGLGWLGLHEELGKAKGKKGKGKGKKGKGKKGKGKKKKNKNKNVDTKGLRQPCTETSECQGDLLCDVAYSQMSCPGQEPPATFCCVQTDAQKKCEDGCDCCGLDVICNGGFCQGA